MLLSIKVALFAVMVAFATAVGEESTYATCEDENSDDVIVVINSTVDRLMELRQPDWGWVNTPEVVLGLQLSAQEQFFGRDKSIEKMKDEINNDLETMNIGKLALYVTALKSACENPKKIDGRDLVKLLERRIRKQFRYDGSAQIVPLDRYYRFGLALGALCVNDRRTKHWVVWKLLKGQNTDGSFGDHHSVDDAAQILLALKCVETERRPCFLMKQVKAAIKKLATFLRSKISTQGSNVWIGNKYSSPSSALALMEADEESPEQWQCEDIMNSLAVNPQTLEKEGGFSQRLPALAGNSYLDLKFTSWQCETPVPVPVGYQPSCNPSDPPTCNPDVGPGPYNPINVTLTIFTDPPPSSGGVPNANVIVTVQNGSTLYEAMVNARDAGQLTFESQTSSWGESITSMQGVVADTDSHEYWALIDGATGNLLPLGVSSYVPANGEQIVFRLKTW